MRYRYRVQLENFDWQYKPQVFGLTYYIPFVMPNLKKESKWFKFIRSIFSRRGKQK